jgi:(2Fe-2S) ferredoxin
VRGQPVVDLKLVAESRPPDGLTLAVGAGTCGLSVGAGNVLAALEAEIARRGLAARVVAGGCNGLCWAAPVVTVLRHDGSHHIATRVAADRVTALLDAALSGQLDHDPDVQRFLSGQRRELIDRCGVTDPGDIDDAIRRGSYAVLANALAAGKPERVIETVKTAGLRGRGGAYFQAAVKWDGARRAQGRPKYLIVNGEEGEPGIFKDRHLMEGDPHRLIEGALLAAHAAGASRIILYIHGEAHLSALRLGGAAWWTALGLELAPRLEIAVNPTDARRLGCDEGARLRVVSHRGELTGYVHVTEAVRPGAIFVPFVKLNESAANFLTNSAHDPSSKIPEDKVCAVRLETVH